jgi:hypothetical protein
LKNNKKENVHTSKKRINNKEKIYLYEHKCEIVNCCC